MFTTGSKLLIGSAVLATLSAIVYGVTQVDSLGIVGLISAALALSFLAGVNIWARDSNVSAMDATAVASCDAAQPVPGNSIWPMVLALGGATVLLGLVTQQSIFVIGVAILFAGGAQWTVQAWAERASSDDAVNAEVRNRLANPLEYPLLGVATVGVVAFAFSRVMLWLSKTNTVIAFVVLATIVALVAFFFAFRPTLKRGAIGGAVALGAVAIVATGVAAGVDGQRDIHPHETISADPNEICESVAATEADEKASQTVSAKANTAAVITLTEGDALEFDVPGPVESGATELSLPRSNANNLLFRNESAEERRLTVDLGETTIENAETGEEEIVRNLLCTTLIERGGVQLLTLTIAEPSFAFADDPEAYRFFVPGTDAELGLFVP